MENEKIELEGELGQIAKTIRNATTLTPADKHNLLVDPTIVAFELKKMCTVKANIEIPKLL